MEISTQSSTGYINTDELSDASVQESPCQARPAVVRIYITEDVRSAREHKPSLAAVGQRGSERRLTLTTA
jgi:hypothetical protein